jgi:hypothetical protein
MVKKHKIKQNNYADNKKNPQHTAMLRIRILICNKIIFSSLLFQRQLQ